MNISNITPDKKAVLKPLTNIPNPPKELFYRGSLDNYGPITVAIVGSRRPNNYGKEMTYKISQALASRGVTIVSGLAFGVDAIAHRACLEASGKTIAVLTSGVDNITPHSNRYLGERIIEQGGAVISEMPVGHIVAKWNFLFRNRLVSGLAQAVIITQATERSGTLSTAAHALNQGKEVYILPGRITDPTSVGCHKLIAQGAHIITSIDDLVESIVPKNKAKQTTLPFLKDPIDNKIIKLINSGISDGDQIIAKLNLTVNDFNFHITLLEVKGIVKSLGANKWILK